MTAVSNITLKQLVMDEKFEKVYTPKSFPIFLFFCFSNVLYLQLVGDVNLLRTLLLRWPLPPRVSAADHVLRALNVLLGLD